MSHRMLILAGAILLLTRAVVAAEEGPADPFVGASPTFDKPPPVGIKFNAGDWGVAEQHGAATYLSRHGSSWTQRNGTAAGAPVLLAVPAAGWRRGGMDIGYSLRQH